MCKLKKLKLITTSDKFLHEKGMKYLIYHRCRNKLMHNDPTQEDCIVAWGMFDIRELSQTLNHQGLLFAVVCVVIVLQLPKTDFTTGEYKFEI